MSLKYISTRGQTPPQTFTDILLSGLADDGGLYLPEQFPVMERVVMERLKGMDYATVAQQVLDPYMDSNFSSPVMSQILHSIYGPGNGLFDHGNIAPLVQVGSNTWIMELFHGPTLAFKDVALQMLGKMFDHILQQRGETITIVGATSGDTGSAAIEACRHCKNINLFMLHPEGRVSEVQRRQMTSVDEPNIHNVALQGTFDDCQNMVKALFGDKDFRTKNKLSAVNSINWARIIAQSVYYFSAALVMGAPQREVSFAVPTGNFGNVLAAHVARQMGLPIKNLIIGSNQNDILTRFFESGEMRTGKVTPTLSPSMDIQISSNFERYLYQLIGGNHMAVQKLMHGFKTSGCFKVSEQHMTQARKDFKAYRCDDEGIKDMIGACYEHSGYVIDPHTAVGLNAAHMAHEDPDVPVIALACAHPSKFPDAVEAAIGIRPELPDRLKDLMERPEFMTALPNDLKKVKDFINNNVA